MCCIAGIIDLKSLDQKIDLARMHQTPVHRAPDGDIRN
jgi:hypothetical protein